MCSLINKQLLLTAYAYLFIMEQQKVVQQGSEALQVERTQKRSNMEHAMRQKIEQERNKQRELEKAKQEAEAKERLAKKEEKKAREASEDKAAAPKKNRLQHAKNTLREFSEAVDRIYDTKEAAPKKENNWKKLEVFVEELRGGQICDKEQLKFAQDQLALIGPQLRGTLTFAQEKAVRRLEGGISVYQRVQAEAKAEAGHATGGEFSSMDSNDGTYWRAHALYSAHRVICAKTAGAKTADETLYRDLKAAVVDSQEAQNGVLARNRYQYLQGRAEFEAYLFGQKRDGWVSLFRNASRELPRQPTKSEQPASTAKGTSCDNGENQPAVGTTVETPMGSYVLEESLKGDVVYRCSTASVESCVIKVIRKNAQIYETHRDLFIPREAALTRLWRPDQVIDWGESSDGEWMFFVTRYLGSALTSPTIKELSERAGDVAKKMVFIKGFAKKMVTAVRDMAKWNIAHRDVKPDNIVYHQDKVRMIDFGSAKVDHAGSNKCQTPVGTAAGHVSFMPPELRSNWLEAKWEESPPRHDPFALAVTLLWISQTFLGKENWFVGYDFLKKNKKFVFESNEKGVDEKEVDEKQKYEYKKEVDEIRNYDEALGDLLRDALMTDPDKRSSIYQMFAIVDEKW